MSQPTQPINESQAVGKVLRYTTRAVNGSLGPFSAWLAAGVGAAFTVLLANLDAVSKFVSPPYIRFAMSCLLIGLVLAIVSKLVSAWISAQLDTRDAIDAVEKQVIDGGRQLSRELFRFEFEKGMLPHVLALSKLMVAKANGDTEFTVRLTAKVSQCQPILVLCEVLSVLAAALAVVLGLKA
jgi:hypothetical protein